MQLDIQARGFSLTAGILNYTEQKMQFALQRGDNYITHTRIRLADINGPRGGVDKKCQIELKLAGEKNIVIEDTQSDLYYAIDRATERCMRTLNRRQQRAREYQHEVLAVEHYND
jgi:putative sigma-54 modulation protein